MSQRESNLSRRIMTELRLAKAWCFKVHGSEYMPAGLPDIIGCYRGRFFAFEVKLPEKRSNTSVMQDRMIAKIQAAGGLAQVVCSPEEAVAALASIRVKARKVPQANSSETLE